MKTLANWRGLEADAKSIAEYTGQQVSEVLVDKFGVSAVSARKAGRRNQRHTVTFGPDQLLEKLKQGVLRLYGDDTVFEVEVGGKTLPAATQWTPTETGLLFDLVADDGGILLSTKLPQA